MVSFIYLYKSKLLQRKTTKRKKRNMQEKTGVSVDPLYLPALMGYVRDNQSLQNGIIQNVFELLIQIVLIQSNT